MKSGAPVWLTWLLHKLLHKGCGRTRRRRIRTTAVRRRTSLVPPARFFFTPSLFHSLHFWNKRKEKVWVVVRATRLSHVIEVMRLRSSAEHSCVQMMPAEHAFAAVRQYLMPLSLSHTHTSPPSALSLKRLSACSHEIFSCRRRRRRVRASTAEPCWVCAWPLADGRLGLLFQARGGVANVQVRHLVRIRIPPPSFCPFSSWASRPIKNGCGCRDNPHGFLLLSLVRRCSRCVPSHAV